MPNSLLMIYNRMGLPGSVITGFIVIAFISGFYINILVRRRYLSLSEELAAFCGGEISEFKSEMLTWITQECKAALNSGVEVINTGAVVNMAIEIYQKPCVIGEGYLKRVNALLITMGLFGTFTGLTSALANLGTIMSGTVSETLISDSSITAFKVLLSSFNGMSVAFITSLFGTGFSILHSLLTTFLGAADARKLFITQLEEYTDIKLASETIQVKIKDPDHKSEIDILSKTLADSLAKFNKLVCSYKEELQALKGFNREFSRNLETADKSVSLLCHSFDKTSEGINFCSNTLNTLVTEIKSENNKLESMNGIFSNLSEKLDESTQDREIFLRVINDIPDKLLNYNEAAVARIERGMYF